MEKVENADMRLFISSQNTSTACQLFTRSEIFMYHVFGPGRVLGRFDELGVF